MTIHFQILDDEIGHNLEVLLFSMVNTLAMSFFRELPSFTFLTLLPLPAKRKSLKASRFSVSNPCNSFGLFVVNSFIFAC